MTASVIACLPALAGPPSAIADGGPRVIQLGYFHRDDGELPHRVLSANARRTTALGFSTVFHGKHASASAYYDDNISGGRLSAKHPWVLQHEGGRAVYKLIRRSLAERGSASIHVRARRGERIDRVKLKISVAKCSIDPPFYPLDCSIHR